jgi:hypothetical protein
MHQCAGLDLPWNGAVTVGSMEKAFPLAKRLALH